MQMGNATAQEEVVNTCLSYTKNLINRGTLGQPKPILKFHTVCGENVQLLKEGRIARRKESFCKGLAFSNRPISVDEIICLRLCEIGNNWSGVLRFGVTNVDPASFRDIELPKFVCPDLTSKAGYWAKAIAERYSTNKSILHFSINSMGELHYGLNGVKKGLFLNNINISLPLWIVVDIYGNSIAVEFIDPADVDFDLENFFNIKNVFHNNIEKKPTSILEFFPDLGASLEFNSLSNKSKINSTTESLGLNSVTNQISTSTKTLPFLEPISRLRFHLIKGLNVSLQNNNTIARRKHGEYYLGYVFTDRPIQNNETLSIKIIQTEEAFSGSLAFGLTSCNPINIQIASLPIDSDELLERSEYWVCIKDVAAEPKIGDKLTFRIDKDGRVFFSKNNGIFRIIMHVDVSINLWAFFDLYGTTSKIQIIDNYVSDFNQANNFNNTVTENLRNANCFKEKCDEFTETISTNLSNCQLQNISEHQKNLLYPSTLNLNQLKTALTTTNNYTNNDNLPSTSAHSSIIPYLSDETSNESITLQNIPTLSSNFKSVPKSTNNNINTLSNFYSSASIESLNLEPVLLPELYREAEINSNLTSSILIDNDFDALALRYSSLLSQRRDELSNKSHQNTNFLNESSTLTQQSCNNFSSSFRNNLYNFSNSKSNCFLELTPSSASNSISLNSPYTNVTVSENNMTNTISAKKKLTTEDAEKVLTINKKEHKTKNNFNINNECTICMNNKVNAVIYRCGHMCMCFECAKETFRRSGDCPICRTPIVDVIRCYPS